jgi:hypothetical protein
VAALTLLVVTGVALAAVSVDQFPASVYPQPVTATPDHALALCPNPSGLQAFDSKATQIALEAAQAYDRASLATDLRNSDRAWWSNVRKLWSSGHPGAGVEQRVVLGSEPAAKSGFAVFMAPACGATTLAKSLLVTIGPPQSPCDACRSHLFFVDRAGRPLIYYLY